jgi:hypothetical protein
MPFGSEGVRYIKIAKVDKNGIDQTNSLQSLTELIIPYSSGTITYNILSITEHPTNFVYYVENPNIEWADRADIEYNFTGTLDTSTIHKFSKGLTPIGIVSGSGDIYDFYSLPNQSYNFNTYAQKDLYFLASGSAFIYSAPTTIALMKANQGILSPSTINTLATQQFLLNGGPQDFNIEFNLSSSQPGDRYYISIKSGGSASFDPSLTFASNPTFLITSSISSGPTIETIPEPYFSQDFSRALDCQPTLNNILTDRKSNKYQDIDYSTGLLSPTNFDLIISGSALKAEVQDSNYTLARHTRPRYEGSRSTSQYLNKWTKGDDNTYGKSPTIESTKIYVAYCDSIGGWPPERMNSSTAFVKYLIKNDGSIVIPNTTENSLGTNQFNFVSGERVEIHSTVANTGNITPYRNIIRGGTRIEPILYTQVGHSPAAWSQSLTLTTDFITDQLAVADYQATAAPSASLGVVPDGVYSGLDFNNPVYLGGAASWSTNGYDVVSGVISENITLNINVSMEIYVRAQAIGAQNHDIVIRLIKLSGGIETILGTDVVKIPSSNNLYNTSPSKAGDISINTTINPQDILENDRFFIRGNHITSTYGTPADGDIYYTNSEFKITQSPPPTNVAVTSSGENTIWGYPDNTQLHAITASSPILSNFYDSDYTQVNDPISGFNNISLPWSLEVGDEFRFEGKEENTFMVSKVYSIVEYDSDRVSPTGSLEVQFSSNLPSASIDLDHFLIRRYVDDASSILIEGFKPDGSTGPYIIKPEYSDEKLNKGIDSFIEDLTERGLI